MRCDVNRPLWDPGTTKTKRTAVLSTVYVMYRSTSTSRIMLRAYLSWPMLYRHMLSSPFLSDVPEMYIETRTVDFRRELLTGATYHNMRRCYSYSNIDVVPVLLAMRYHARTGQLKMTTGKTVQALNTLKNLLHQRLAESEWLSKEVKDQHTLGSQDDHSLVLCIITNRACQPLWDSGGDIITNKGRAGVGMYLKRNKKRKEMCDRHAA